MLGKIMQDLKASFNECDNYKRKIQILTLSPYTINNTAKFFETSIYMVNKSRSIKREYGIIPEVPSMSKGKVISNKEKLLVKEFYESDEVSRMCPGQKDCLTVRNSEGVSCKVQKRLILGNLKELYELYKNNATNPKVGFSTFAKLRPSYCVLAGAGGTHCVCVCTYHQNPKLQLAALGEKGLTYKDLMDYSVCNSEREECMMMTCKDCPREEGVQAFLELLNSVQSASEEIMYKQWVTTDRCTMITEVKILHEFLTSLSSKITSLVRHHFVAQKQAQYFKDLKENLPFHSEAVVVGDFSENYSFIVQDAAQGFHYENSQCTVHPFIVYFKSNDSHKLCHKSFCFLSDSTKHNTVMVHTFISKLIPNLKVSLPNIKKIHYFSDGCVGQYKNKYNFKNLCYHNEDYGLTCEWNFFATSHGKSACDGIGGTIKRATARASLQRTTSGQILTPEDMFRFCEESLSSNIKYFFVSKCELEESNRKLMPRFEDVCTIPGTRQYHRFVPKNTEELMVYLFSSSPKGELKRIIHTPGDTVHDAVKFTNAKVGQYVGCAYDKKIWFGIVDDYNEEFDDFLVNFLEPSATFGIRSYNFPTRKDTCSVPADSILAIMSPPSLKGGRRLEYIFQEEEVSKLFKSANTKFKY